MKRHNRIYLLIIACITVTLFYASCEKTVDIDDDANREWVLNGVPTAGDRAFVYFANTRFFLDSSNNQPVDNATLTLTVNGIPLSPDSVSKCKYFFPHILQEDDSLNIDIEGNGRHIHAETYIPLLPDISAFEVAPVASESFNFYTVKIQLNDHPNRKEYYNIVVNVRDSGMRYDAWGDSLEFVDTIRQTYFLIPFNPEITSNEVNPYIPLGGYLYTRTMFKDDLIDGTQDDILLYLFNINDTNERPPFKHEYFVQVESITPARWNYLISSSQQSSSFSVFAEQGSVWSNIEGALGIFAGNARRKYAFDPDTITNASISLSIPPISHPTLIETRAHRKPF